MRLPAAIAIVCSFIAAALLLAIAQAGPSPAPGCQVVDRQMHFLGDVQSDGKVDAVDIGIVRSQFNCHAALPTPTVPAPTATPAPGAPDVFGVNLGLYDAQDQFLASALTRQRLLDMGVTHVRMPIRAEGCPAAHEVLAAQRIAELGLTPMIILKYTQPNPLAAAQCVIDRVDDVAPGFVMYEFGNERDLAGVTATQYRAQWNAIVPSLRPLAPGDWFGGPVTAWPNATYIATFVDGASPPPDFVSYHNYACDNDDSAAECIDNITEADGDDWSDNLDNVRAAIAANGDPVPPIYVTEWSYDPVPPPGDPRPTAAFWDAFIRAGLEEWQANGVDGATYYVLTDSIYELVDDAGSLTAAGAAFAAVAP